ncbi:unnamed protein product [Adineta ricciae]|uniref:Uncharacterized protein n=1 Tax=Adineta ricciae TaxID=249248 RepID=A0A814VT73_ADIRI|nr:unnamed protein product [Adineta ricciae]CAF1191526.1 unnamed protein product [Adineta ricciae]
MMLAYSTEPSIYLRLPTNVNLIVEIRDTFSCILSSNTSRRQVVLRSCWAVNSIDLTFAQRKSGSSLLLLELNRWTMSQIIQPLASLGQIYPLDFKVSYLLIYYFDHRLQLNSMQN